MRGLSQLVTNGVDLVDLFRALGAPAEEAYRRVARIQQRTFWAVRRAYERRGRAPGRSHR